MDVKHLFTIYTGLAQALAPPTYGLPDWLCVSGRTWPIFQPAVEMAAQQFNPTWRQAVEALAALKKKSSQAARRSEYEALFVGRGRPPIWLYESRHVNGRIPGPATFSVQALYKQAGLESESAELPDHAALELSFLVFLCQQEIKSADPEWRAVRRLFIKKHASLWLPNVGRALIHSEYPAWQALGYLLVASLSSSKQLKAQKPEKASAFLLPSIMQPNECTLCGFCVQICPTRALNIVEEESNTTLLLSTKHCIACDHCVRVCIPKALTLESAENTPSPIILRQSERAICPACDTHTVSQAEIDAILTQLGEHPRWLDYCLNCRPYQMELSK